MKAAFQTCPDGLAARARQGALSRSEWQELTTHLAACADCRVTWRMMVDFEQSAAPAPGDERILERAAKLALAGSRNGRDRAFGVGAAAAVILMVAGVSSAAILLRVRHADVPSAQTAPARAAGPRARKGAASPAPRSVALEAPATVPAPAPVLPAPAGVPPAAPAVPKAMKRAIGHLAFVAPRTVPLPTVEDASTLFARALSEREQGRTTVALTTFRSLQSRFPGTPQAVLSLVSLADLALDAGDAVAALAAFEQYLAAAPSGPLVPESLAGKARALNALGQATEADSVWREITRRFPDSPYARRSTGSRSPTP